MNQYAYLAAGIILGTGWFVIFLLREDLRTRLVWGGVLGLPFGFSEFLYIPEYWSPPSVFDLIDKIGFGVESLMFGFFTGGMAAAIYRFVLPRRSDKGLSSRQALSLSAYGLMIAAYLGAEILFPDKSIYNLSTACALGAIFVGVRRRALIQQILISGLMFGALYFVLFLLFNLLFPDFIASVYTLENFWGVMIFGVPAEEIVFAASVGGFWTVLVEQRDDSY